jgi:hypothetical protein
MPCHPLILESVISEQSKAKTEMVGDVEIEREK